MTFARAPLQVVEIDLDYCPLTFGVAPCAAALSGSTVRKCYNTYATCRNVANFGRLAEPASPDEYDDGDVVPHTSYTKTADLFFAADVVIPDSAPDGCIFELGGSGTGAYLGFSFGELVFRAGLGASPTTETANLRVDGSAIYGKTGTFYGAIDVSASQVQLWFYEPETQTLTDFGTATASAGFPSGAWAGTSDGEFGGSDGNSPFKSVGVPESQADFNGTSVKLRMYDSTTYTPTTTGNTLTLRYTRNQTGVPRDEGLIFPALESVSSRAARVNLGGVDAGIGALGTRERVTVGLRDFTHHDRGVDKYADERKDGTAQTDEGGYDPATRGTHFGKLHARWPHYYGRAMRVREGRVGEAFSSMTTRNFVITEWSGPDASGAVRIEGKDVLDFADDDKALCPAPSVGRLAEDITATDTTFTLSVAGDGAAYAASGRVCIGSEIMTYTRSGDTFTVVRGRDNTEATTHSADDTVQECYRVEDTPIEQVIRDLLQDYAGVPSDYITYSDWQDEGTSRWLAGFNLTTTITKPTGVAKLLEEIVQLGCVIWWDSTAQKIRLRSNRPVDLSETIPDLSDDATVLAGSLGRETHDDKRLTRVIVAHGMIDYTGSVDSVENYTRFSVAIDPESESGFEGDQTRVHWIYSRWLGTGNDAIANPVARRTLNRYLDAPEQVSFTATAKDRPNVGLADVISLTTRVIQDETGLNPATQLQITGIEDRGEQIAVTAETFTFAGRYGYITGNSRPVYASSSAAQIAKGTYIVGSSLTFGDGTGPYLMF